MGLGSPKRDGCFLIGSGPSLAKVDVSRLTDLETISFNRSYVAWDQWGFAPTMYACLDPVVVEDNLDELRALISAHPATRFFLDESFRVATDRDYENVSYCHLDSNTDFATSTEVIRDFGNVGATSIQLLRVLGFCRIAITGVDARYATVRNAAPDDAGYVRPESSDNYFCAEYVRGKRLRARPDLERILGGWPQVADECKRHAIEVRNASPGSALSCFPTMDFFGAIQWVENR